LKSRLGLSGLNGDERRWNEVSFAKDNVASFVKSSTTVADASWHHLVVTKSGATRKLYIDGVDRTSLLTNQTLINTTSALFLGAKNGTAGFLVATVDEFAVYNQALSLATVLDHYKAGSGTGWRASLCGPFPKSMGGVTRTPPTSTTDKLTENE
jgi:hypothetical protein